MVRQELEKQLDADLKEHRKIIDKMVMEAVATVRAAADSSEDESSKENAPVKAAPARAKASKPDAAPHRTAAKASPPSRKDEEEDRLRSSIKQLGLASKVGLWDKVAPSTLLSPSFSGVVRPSAVLMPVIVARLRLP